MWQESSHIMKNRFLRLSRGVFSVVCAAEILSRAAATQGPSGPTSGQDEVGGAARNWVEGNSWDVAQPEFELGNDAETILGGSVSSLGSQPQGAGPGSPHQDVEEEDAWSETSAAEASLANVQAGRRLAAKGSPPSSPFKEDKPCERGPPSPCATWAVTSVLGPHTGGEPAQRPSAPPSPRTVTLDALYAQPRPNRGGHANEGGKPTHRSPQPDPAAGTGDWLTLERPQRPLYSSVRKNHTSRTSESPTGASLGGLFLTSAGPSGYAKVPLPRPLSEPQYASPRASDHASALLDRDLYSSLPGSQPELEPGYATPTVRDAFAAPASLGEFESPPSFVPPPPPSKRGSERRVIHVAEATPYAVVTIEQIEAAMREAETAMWLPVLTDSLRTTSPVRGPGDPASGAAPSLPVTVGRKGGAAGQDGAADAAAAESGKGSVAGTSRSSEGLMHSRSLPPDSSRVPSRPPPTYPPLHLPHRTNHRNLGRAPLRRLMQIRGGKLLVVFLHAQDCVLSFI
ncbi:hypothetical protein BESB_071350 [Besnoitia besnoiti]|uniref:Uncharacterized protein n=1 Tax=Besnoitia besnoiti TaxID=94643 RepID=A0A2A9ME87_BESBE|nr:uncharacterized protein BESB_071350 [Besnoitia besnoiti]PFH33983.1 hypothetical protein BESB_071350 [Besnoitia besnoiti]